MFFKKFDFLSPPITLYFKGEKAHSSVISGILAIIAYSGIIGFSIYYALQFINRENPVAYFFNRYIEDAGTFPMNSSSMFSFLQMMNSKELLPKDTDFDSVRVIGLDRITIDNYMKDNDLEHYNHWLYGNCNNESDTEGIGYLVNQDKFRQSACIRKYYDMNKKRYFEVGDSNFVWPIIHHGMSHPDANMYGVILEKCRNDSLRALSGAGVCKTPEYIEEYVYSSYVRFILVDNYADVLNYEMPLTKYLFAVTNGVFSGTFTTNHLNFNPAQVITDNGIFVENIKEEVSYIYSFNEKITSDQDILVTDDIGNPILDENGNEKIKQTGIIICFYFWMQNNLQLYQRKYQKFQDVLGDIGGLTSIILTVVAIINLLISDFIILLDTEELALSFNYKNTSYSELRKKPIIFRKEKENLYPPRRIVYNRNDSQSQQRSTNFLRSSRNEDMDYDYNNKEVQNDYNISSNQNYNFDNIYNINRNKRNRLNEFKGKKSEFENFGYIRKAVRKKENIEPSRDTDKIEGENILSKKPNEKQNFSWFSYIKYIVLCGKNNPYISYYEDFRAKLISEENIIQNYIDVYKLLEVNKLKK
jgi:hypothetical protein